MPRPSKEKTNVATLRILLGEKQDGFAKLIGCSIHTLQSVETGRMKLGKSLAARISLITGVHIEWLLKNLKCKPFAAVPNRYIISRKGRKVRITDEREPYTLDTFRKAQRLQRIPEFISLLILDYMFSFYGQMRAILNSAAEKGLAGAAILTTARWLGNLRGQFGHDNSIVPTPELRLRNDGSPVLTYRQRDSGLKAMKRDVEDWEKRSSRSNAETRSPELS
jgi:DNA-binding XRE family transcriptional regulator